MFPGTSYNPDTLALLTRAFDDAWKDVQSALVVNRLPPTFYARGWRSGYWLQQTMASAILLG